MIRPDFFSRCQRIAFQPLFLYAGHWLGLLHVYAGKTCDAV